MHNTNIATPPYIHICVCICIYICIHMHIYNLYVYIYIYILSPETEDHHVLKDTQTMSFIYPWWEHRKHLKILIQEKQPALHPALGRWLRGSGSPSIMQEMGIVWSRQRLQTECLPDSSGAALCCWCQRVKAPEQAGCCLLINHHKAQWDPRRQLCLWISFDVKGFPISSGWIDRGATRVCKGQQDEICLYKTGTFQPRAL